MADGNWYYSKGGQQLGPVSADELRQKIASNEVSAQDLVWRDGMANWVAASTVPEFAGGGGGAAAYGAPAAYAPAPGGYAPPGQPAPGYVGYAQPGQSNVPTYLVQSILVTIFCCLIGGIIAIVNSAKVNKLLAAGDYAGAVAASNAAKKWCTISVVVGLVVIVLNIVLQVSQSR